MSAARRRLPIALVLAGALGLVGACRSAQEDDAASSAQVFGAAPGSESAARAPASVSGTTVLAATGRPLGGVLVRGPGGLETTSDAQGRFVLEGLAVGVSGVLEASSDSGLVAKNRLRPLKSGVLEVVLRLR